VPDGCRLTRFATALFEGQEPPMRTYPEEASSYHMLERWRASGLGVALLPESKLSAPEVRHRRLVDNDQKVEIFYTAVWDSSSALAADIASLFETLSPAEVHRL
jgi:DNA-binding transcriptional LysR family regulator